MKTFKFYLFNIALNGTSVAVYEESKYYELVVEGEDGKKLAGYETILLNIEETDSITDEVADRYVDIYDDVYLNSARALSNVLDALDVREFAGEEMG